MCLINLKDDKTSGVGDDHFRSTGVKLWSAVFFVSPHLTLTLNHTNPYPNPKNKLIPTLILTLKPAD